MRLSTCWAQDAEVVAARVAHAESVAKQKELEWSDRVAAAEAKCTDVHEQLASAEELLGDVRKSLRPLLWPNVPLQRCVNSANCWWPDAARRAERDKANRYARAERGNMLSEAHRCLETSTSSTAARPTISLAPLGSQLQGGFDTGQDAGTSRRQWDPWFLPPDSRGPLRKPMAGPVITPPRWRALGVGIVAGDPITDTTSRPGSQMAISRSYSARAGAAAALKCSALNPRRLESPTSIADINRR